MKNISLTVCLFSFLGLFAQNSDHVEHETIPCDIDNKTEAFFNKYPAERATAAAAHAELEEFTRNFTDSPLREDDVIIIPVVFHVVHVNGPENVPYSELESAIDLLNTNYEGQNGAANSVVTDFQDIVANVGFEFRLARLDPDGNCTNGVVRVYDNSTNSGSDNLKSVSPTWGRESYLNVWVCNSIESIGAGTTLGYSYLPGDMNGSFGATIDGIVIGYNFLTDAQTLTHEVGHWANLPHTWGSGNTPGQPGNCNSDDGVADTPATVGWTTCDLQGFTCGSLDNVENFMEYSECSKMFTNGQKAKMRAALNSGISQRNQLGSEANLIETGVLDDDVICEVNFSTTSERTVCPDQDIDFTDLSFNGVTSWEWSFPGGTPATSSEQNPTVTYATAGDYSVSLTVSNDSGSETEVKADYITILPAAGNDLPASEGFESFTSFEPNTEQWSVINEGSNTAVKWEIADNVGYEGSVSAYVKGISNDEGNTEFLQSPTYDLSGLTENAVLKFKYAHARRSLNSEDVLRVSVSKNCGENWSIRETLSGTDLPTVSSSVTSEFTPNSQSDWTEVEISNISSTFFTESFRFRFEFTSVNGNNIYVDNINLIDPTTVGLEPVDFVQSLRLFPNPNSGQFTLDYSLKSSGQTKIDVLDITGRLIMPVFDGNSQAGLQTQQIDITKLDAGIYFVRLSRDGQQITRRVLVQ